MKIKSSIREKYMELCPASTMKCSSFEEIDYKIRRAVEIGHVMKTYPQREIQYHNLRFIVKDERVVDMFKNDQYIAVSEYKKSVHECKYYKIVV
ncbi:hypothetical protein BSK50_14130 [Paenibacillus odorifer]|nr:hypothetical protein BSK50_14130 [Paenibacillus odorifer]